MIGTKMYQNVLRWFRPAPPPPPEMPPLIRALLDRVKAEGLSADLTTDLATRAAPSKPPNPFEPDPEVPKWSWQEYASNRDKAGVHPGWAFCRFANRAYGNHDRNTEVASFVFGFTRGAFGVWSRHMDVCSVNDDEHASAQQLLTTITHLQTGYGVGVFAERDVAMEAAELAERVYPAWAGAGDVMSAEGRDRTSQAWEGVGIVPSTNAHAHSPENSLITLPIYGRSEASVLLGKPEKLS